MCIRDRSFTGDPAAVAPAEEEIHYLCGVINEYFRAGIMAADVVWAYAGVRALYNDGAKMPQDIDRDYALILDKSFGVAPLLTVYGGKLTTFRRLAEDVLARLAHFFPRSRPWTATSPLPGGDFVYDGAPALVALTQRNWPFLDAGHARRLVGAYGTRVENVLADVTRPDDLGPRFGADLTGAEVRYLMTVSYTHLDVYKRQTNSCSGSTASTAISGYAPMTSAGAACCCCFCAAARSRPCGFPAARFRRMTDMGRCTSRSRSPPMNLRRGRSGLRRPISLSRAAPKWPRGGESVYFRDPDGHLLELATPGLWPGY